ncbi:MAG: FAD-dependent oxidoreductase [bacterium]|nr:FAD-dependent oxidoreductase [bacterium]
MALTKVFEPIRLGPIEVPNRIFRSAHGTQFDPGKLDDTLIQYHLDRAISGVGLTILEIASVHPSSSTVALTLWDDSVIERYQKLMNLVKPHGMRVFQQLWHGGAQVMPIWGGAPWSASARTGPFTPRRAKAMTVAEIQEIVQAFGDAAGRCARGGLDGVEIQLGHGYLMQQFLSPLWNERTDEYGGSWENRLRLPREVLRVVREATGPNMAVGVRISSDLSPGGLTPKDCAKIVETIEADGVIDFVNGSQSSYFSLSKAVPAMDQPVGAMMPQTATIVHGLTRVPRLVTPGRIRSLEEAEQILRDGDADMISIVRGMIAEPDMMRKSREGRLQEVRPCIACNQGCVAPAAAGQRIGCTVNAVIGLEETMSERLITPVANPAKIVIVGGGPAGMEAARVAATMGHDVVLFEAAPNTGGLVNVAKRGPKLHTLGDITYWLESEIYRLGVDVRLNSYVDADEVMAEKPHAVIVATGSMPSMDGVQRAIPGLPAQGIEQPHVLSSVDLLTGSHSDLGQSALVLDDLGHFEAIACAEHLLDKGLSVTFATRMTGMSIGVEMTLRLEPTLERLRAHGDRFTVKNRVRLSRIGPNDVDLVTLEGNQTQTLAADTVVLVLDRQSMRDVHADLLDKVAYLKVVGDAESPWDLQVAIREGHMAARAIPEDLAVRPKHSPALARELAA